MSNCNHCEHISNTAHVHPVGYCAMYNKDVTFSCAPKNCPKFKEMKESKALNIGKVLERANALTALSKENETLKTEIKELYQILGLSRTRHQYLKAVKLWQKDTNQSKLCHPDLGGHWQWALEYIELGMILKNNIHCFKDVCNECNECKVIKNLFKDKKHG